MPNVFMHLKSLAENDICIQQEEACLNVIEPSKGVMIKKVLNHLIISAIAKISLETLSEKADHRRLMY